MSSSWNFKNNLTIDIKKLNEITNGENKTSSLNLRNETFTEGNNSLLKALFKLLNDLKTQTKKVNCCF